MKKVLIAMVIAGASVTVAAPAMAAPTNGTGPSITVPSDSGQFILRKTPRW
jgi:hypothetical protein